jgi:hypothetical protein
MQLIKGVTLLVVVFAFLASVISGSRRAIAYQVDAAKLNEIKDRLTDRLSKITSIKVEGCKTYTKFATPLSRDEFDAFCVQFDELVRTRTSIDPTYIEREITELYRKCNVNLVSSSSGLYVMIQQGEWLRIDHKKDRKTTSSIRKDGQEFQFLTTDVPGAQAAYQANVHPTYTSNRFDSMATLFPGREYLPDETSTIRRMADGLVRYETFNSDGLGSFILCNETLDRVMALGSQMNDSLPTYERRYFFSRTNSHLPDAVVEALYRREKQGTVSKVHAATLLLCDRITINPVLTTNSFALSVPANTLVTSHPEKEGEYVDAAISEKPYANVLDFVKIFRDKRKP